MFSHLLIHCFIIFVFHCRQLLITLRCNLQSHLLFEALLEETCIIVASTDARYRWRLRHVARTSLLFLQTTRRLGTRLLDSLLGLLVLPLLPVSPLSYDRRLSSPFDSPTDAGDLYCDMQFRPYHADTYCRCRVSIRVPFFFHLTIFTVCM